MRYVCYSKMPRSAAALLVLAGSIQAANDPYLLNAAPSVTVKAAGTPVADADPFKSLFEQASAAQCSKHFEEALTLFQKAASIADIRSRPMSWLTAEFNACHTLNLQGKNNEAADLARVIVSECETAFGSADPLTSEALTHLAFVLKQHGRLHEAEPVYRRNVQILEDKYGSDHYLVAHAICRHGSLLLSVGRLHEAEDELRRALSIAITTTSTSGDRSDLCYFITHLAYCLRSGEKADEARQLMDLAYSIVQQDKDLNKHPLAGSILRRQAEYYRDVQELDRAEELGRQCLTRLARRHDVNRMKFYYNDMVTEVYRSILRAKGLNPAQVTKAVEKIQQEGTEAQKVSSGASAARTTAAAVVP